MGADMDARCNDGPRFDHGAGMDAGGWPLAGIEGIEGLGWGLGMAVVVDGDATANFDRTGDYWWSGFYGTTFFVSPSTGLVGVVLSQNQPGPYSPTPYVDYLAQALAFFGL